jgi:pentatricopeptide repeat protein
LNHWDDIDGILNHWMGRFNRKNFPPLIAEMARTGALEHSIRVFNWMKAQRCYRARNDIYNNMIWLHARHQRAEQARGLFFEMQEWRCKPDVETFNALMNAHGRAGQWRWALNIFDDMIRAAVSSATLYLSGSLFLLRSLMNTGLYLCV